LQKPKLKIIKDNKVEKKTLILYTLGFSPFHKVDLKRCTFSKVYFETKQQQQHCSFYLIKKYKNRICFLKYSQTCVQRPPLGPGKSGRLKEVPDLIEV
jgi:hypothetical protein